MPVARAPKVPGPPLVPGHPGTAPVCRTVLSARITGAGLMGLHTQDGVSAVDREETRRARRDSDEMVVQSLWQNAD
ncbi:unnamed protein product [Lota lota]